MSERIPSSLCDLPSDWELKNIGQLATRVGSGVTPTGGSEVYTESGITFIRSQNVTNEGLLLDDVAYIDPAIHERMSGSEVLPFDVLLNITGASIGRCCYVPDGLGPANANQHVCTVRLPGAGSSDAKFLTSVLVSHIGQRQITLLNAGGNREGLNYQQLRSFVVPWPRPESRAKIATILTTLDEVIEATEKLVEKHQQIKAGLMHDLFTRGLWTRPELARGDHEGLPSEASAKEGQLRPTPEEAPGLYQTSPLGLIPKAWCAKKLPEVVDFWDGKRIPLKEDDRAEMEGDIPYYGASGIIDWIDRWLFDDELILLGEDGENIISRNLPLAFKVVGKCWVNNHAHVMKPKSGQSIDYWTNYLEWRDYSRMTSGSAQPKITQSHLSRMHVAEPPEEEQAAIATRMDAIHFLIAGENTHLAKLRQQKQGLMHDLLTGRVRVDGLAEP